MILQEGWLTEILVVHGDAYDTDAVCNLVEDMGGIVRRDRLMVVSVIQLVRYDG